MNRGELRHAIEIWENKEADKKNRLGDTPEKPEKVADVFAKIEFKGGGLLSGRLADSVLAQTTQKFVIDFRSYPDLQPDKNWIMYRGKKFNILYVLNEDFKDEFLQIFTNEMDY